MILKYKYSRRKNRRKVVNKNQPIIQRTTRNEVEPNKETNEVKKKWKKKTYYCDKISRQRDGPRIAEKDQKDEENGVEPDEKPRK